MTLKQRNYHVLSIVRREAKGRGGPIASRKRYIRRRKHRSREYEQDA
ncbi:hypothetical protein [Nitratifractor sp.]